MQMNGKLPTEMLSALGGPPQTPKLRRLVNSAFWVHKAFLPIHSCPLWSSRFCSRLRFNEAKIKPFFRFEIGLTRPI